MKLKIYTASFLMSLTALSAYSKVEWLAKEYNFGTIREEGGKVTGSVKLVNCGPEETFINRVRPSCGCTGASYTHTMIQPGDTATVSFTYNPQGRPGAFDKTVKVYMGPDNDLTVIRIFGTVIGSAATLQSQFPIEKDNLRLENTIVPGGELKRGQSRHLFLNVYNQGDKVINPTWKEDSEGLSVDLSPKEIAPGESGTFTFHIKTAKEPADGPYEYPVTIYTDGKGSESITVTVSGVILPDVSKMSPEELDSAPQAFLLPEFVDLGEKVGAGDLQFEFYVLNEGKNPLNVQKITSRNEGVEITRVPTVINGGEKGLVKGKLRVKKIPEGAFRIKVDVVTDDPRHSVRTCSIVGVKGK